MPYSPTVVCTFVLLKKLFSSGHVSPGADNNVVLNVVYDPTQLIQNVNLYRTIVKKAGVSRQVFVNRTNDLRSTLQP